MQTDKERIRELEDLLKQERLKRLKIKMHMQVIVSHPVGLATQMICKKYTRERITKEFQISTQN